MALSHRPAVGFILLGSSRLRICIVVCCVLSASFKLSPARRLSFFLVTNNTPGMYGNGASRIGASRSSLSHFKLLGDTGNKL